jgi:hypothetical protein
METLGNQNLAKKRIKYICEKCDFNSCNKSDYTIHLQTRKHFGNHWQPFFTEKTQQKQFYDCLCGKKYCDKSGLWKHKKKCPQINDINKNIQNLQDNNIGEINKGEQIVLHEKYKEEQIMEIMKYLIKDSAEFKTMMLEQHNMMLDVIKNGLNNTVNNTMNNSHNKTFNLNFFLNETCKDAMNLSEFINTMHIELEDLEKLDEVGFVVGVSNIIIKNLRELDITKRPMHCLDKKREIVYVKEHNKWEKEDEFFSRVRKLVKKAIDKNFKLLDKFQEKHPDCVKSDSPYSDKFDRLLVEALGGPGDNDLEKENKIIKLITREVVINKKNYY